MWNHLKKEKNYRNFGKTGMNDTFPNIRQRSNLFYSQNTLIFICSYMHNLIKHSYTNPMLKLYNIRDLGNSHHTPLLTDYIAAYVDIF